MSYAVAVVDTNVVVAGLLTGNIKAPTAQILNGMRSGAFRFLLSSDLLAEYREVLLRRKIRALHGLNESEVDALLTTLATHAIVREPDPLAGAPDAKDNHLWSLLATKQERVLVTGDLALMKKPPAASAVISPRAFLALIP